MRLLTWWFSECRVPLHCHYAKVPSDPEEYYQLSEVSDNLLKIIITCWKPFNCVNKWLILDKIISIIKFTQPLRSGRIWHRVNFLSGVQQVWIQSFPRLLGKAEEHSLPYYLPIAGGRIIGFIPFPRVLVLCEIQSVSSRIWTRVAVSISYDDNHYTTGTYHY